MDNLLTPVKNQCFRAQIFYNFRKNIKTSEFGKSARRNSFYICDAKILTEITKDFFATPGANPISVLFYYIYY